MRKSLWIILAALLGLSTLNYGQTIDATLVGSVTDASGAALPNATVEITNVATGIKTSTKTNAEGQYRFNNLPVGFYNMTVSASGFNNANLKKVEIQLSKTSTVNVPMTVG